MPAIAATDATSRQVHRDPCCRPGIGQRIDAAKEIGRDRFDTRHRPTFEIGNRCSIEGDIEGIGGGCADDTQVVNIIPAIDSIRSVSERVVEGVVARHADQCIVAAATDERVVAGATIERVGTAPTDQDVVATKPLQIVGAAKADEHVLLSRTGDRRGIRGRRGYAGDVRNGHAECLRVDAASAVGTWR
jgi:DNA-binding FrmR family transcriptional regulator